jgi:carbon-monoxide dehydrogenase large subunit
MTWVGRSLPRREDPELLRGVARYVGDLVRPGMLHAAFLRSPFPHARIRGIDTSAALAFDGVAAVLTGADLAADLPPQPCNHLYHGQRETPYFALARDRVRYVGEPVAVVVAESPYVAEDAREEIVVDWKELASTGNAEAALADGAPLLYDDWPDNVAATYETAIGDADAAIAAADVVVRERFDLARLFACPLEGRGALAEWDEGIGELTFWTSTQGPHIARDYLSWVLGLPSTASACSSRASAAASARSSISTPRRLRSRSPRRRPGGPSAGSRTGSSRSSRPSTRVSRSSRRRWPRPPTGG